MLKEDIVKYPTRYLGSKHKLLGWIWDSTERHLKEAGVQTIIDPFSGTGLVSFLYKQKGFRVISNDFLLFNHYTAKALIENNCTALSEEEIQNVSLPPASANTFVQDEYTDLFFSQRDTRFLDDIHPHILRMDDEYKRALSFAALSYAILKKAPYGRFTTTKASDPRGRSIQEFFVENLRRYNGLVFSNGKENLTHCADANVLMPQVQGDAVYFDPPYGGGRYNKYEHFYNFVELYINYWDTAPKSGKLKKVTSISSDFSFTGKYKETLKTLLVNSEHIPLWLFSYNDNGRLTLDELKDLIGEFKKNIIVESVDYEYANKIKGYKEFLVVAS